MGITPIGEKVFVFVLDAMPTNTPASQGLYSSQRRTSLTGQTLVPMR